MSESKNKVKNKITLRVDLKEKPERWPKFVAYLTTRSGRIVSKQELEPEKGRQIGVAEFDIDSEQKSLILKVGPEVDDPRLLERYNPYVKALELADEIKVDIPRELWYCWLKTPYFVTGTVKKVSPRKLSPICIGEVEIYDVDLKYCFLKLPYMIIERIRDSIIDIILDPPPVDPRIIERIEKDTWLRTDEDEFYGTGPKAVNIRSKLEALPKEWSFAVERYERLSTARTRINTKLQEISMQERRVFLNSNALEGLTISQVLYSNTKQFRELLVDNLVHIKYWLCWWPWIYWLWWPYCRYSSTELLGETSLNPDGSFNKTVWLSICRNDIPDLWFKVKQIIGGVERVIYSRYPIPCNTYWNHPSGVPVHLQVTHPLAEVCQENGPDIPEAYVMPMGIYEDEWHEVENAHIKSHCDPAISLPSDSGLYEGTDPYGTRLDLRMHFHDDMHEYYYKWSYRLHGESDWTLIDTPISHRYIERVGGEWVITYENLGPKTVESETGLFMVPDPTRSWLGNRNDLAYAIWYTAGGDIDYNELTDGKYDLKLEIFDKDGNKATPETAGFKFILPTDVIGEVDDTLHVEPGGELIMHLHVDNRVTVAEIRKILLNNEPTGECQFLEYERKDWDTAKVGIEYVAYHPTTPENFLASYSLSVIRGISGKEVAGFSSSTPVREPGRQEEYKVSHLLRREPPLEPLEEPYEQCAFSISLHTYPKTRDGHDKIRAYEASDSSAFALTKRTGQKGGGSP